MSSVGDKHRISAPIDAKQGDVVIYYGKHLTLTHFSSVKYDQAEHETEKYWRVLNAAWAVLNGMMNEAGSNFYAVMKESDGVVEIYHGKVP